MAKTKEIAHRAWLNPKDHEDTGHVKVSGSESTWSTRSGDDSGYEVYASFDLADCSRKVCLEFGFSDEKGFKQRLAKIDVLMKALERLRTFLVARAKAHGVDVEA